MRLVRSVLGIAALAASGGAAAAAPKPEQVVSEYHAAPVCPGEFTFRAQVQARTAQFELTPVNAGEQPDAPRRFVVWLSQTSDGYAGTLEIWRNRVVTKSSMVAPTCDEVVAGLSIAAAMSADSAPPATATVTSPVPTLPAVPAASPPAATSKRPSGARSRELLLGVTGGARVGYAPSATVGGGLSFGRLMVPRSSGLAWEAGVGGALGSAIRNASTPSTRLDFSFLGAHADLCPVRTATGRDSQLLGCAALEVGLTHALASTGESATRPWFAPGLSLRFVARFGGVFVAPELGVKAPLVRDHYWFRRDTLAFHTPPVVAEAALTGGIAF